jgi:uncharacterized protein YjiK
VRFTLGRSYRIDVKEPSGLAFLSSELGFVTVDDDASKVIRLLVPKDPDGDVVAEEIDSGGHRHLLRGLEGIAFDPEVPSLLVLSEDSRDVSELAIDPARNKLKLGEPIKRKTLDKIGHEKAHGWEGIAILPARLAPDRRARLLAVHERDPRGVAVLDRATLAMESYIPLPKDLAREADDLSDLTIDPRSGHLFLLSDESAAVLETILEGATAEVSGAGASARPLTWSLRAVGRTPLPDPDKKRRLQPEGLAFDDAGDLWVVSEGDRSLRRLHREP